MFAEALLGDRKDALTERPLDFDKEELTRKGETIKWLESHFGSESRSSKDSREDDIEPTKKSFFNVTIKSNATTPTTGTAKPFPSTQDYNGSGTPFSNVVVPEREINPKTKYFQGISEWSERKNTPPRIFPTKSFQEELKGTLERNRNRHRVGSREELRPNRLNKDEVDFKRSGKTEQRYGSRGDLRYRRDSNGGSDDSRNLKAQKEDLGYLSARNDSKEELYAKSTKKQNGYLHREDSGYVKDSREDIRYLKNGREDSFVRDSGEENYKDINKSIIQRDDSAYVSSSTYFTAPRSPVPPQKMRTPDSGIRSPSPDNYDSEDIRPTVPQRKRVLEKKLRLTQNGYSQNQKRNEPSPDYSPPSRSRSISPPPMSQQLNGGMKKYQRTRFASETPRPTSTQTSQTQTASPPSKQNKVSTVIGNSLRKLVGKIRSASAERKMKMKSKQRSPSPTTKSQQQHQQSMTNGASTYQQYNVIDSHIGQSNRESSVVSGASRRERTIDRRGSSDVDMASPKQKYYLGEDPYGGSIYGKENRYDGVRPQRNHSRRLRSEDVELYSPSR